MILSKALPALFLIIILLFSGLVLANFYRSPEIHPDIFSYIPENTNAVAYLNEESGNAILFHSNNSSGILFLMKQTSIASIVPPVIKESSNLSVAQIYCFQGIPLYELTQRRGNETQISGIPSLILKNFGISDEQVIFASPNPGIFIIGNISTIEESISDSYLNHENGLLHDLNLSARFSFAYIIDSNQVKTITGNYSNGILTSRILTGSIREAVGISLTLQYVLGKGFIALPELDSVILIFPGNNSFVFLQYSLIRNILSMDGVNV